jgi:hypothetical protein
MSRLSKKLARKRPQRIAVPGEHARLLRLARLSKQLEQARSLRKLRDAFEETTAEMVKAGYTLREYDGPKPRRWPLLPEWNGKEPPEKP